MTEISTQRPMREEQRPARDQIDEVAPGILRLQLPISFPGLGHVNCYAMEDDRGIALVDPGLPGIRTWRHLKKQLKTVGIPIDRVHTVVVTHSHPDHFGQVGRFKKAAGAEIISHRNFRTFLDPEAEADDEQPVTVIEAPPAGSPNGCDHDHRDGDTHSHEHTHSRDHSHSQENGTGQAADGPTPSANPFPAVTPWGGKPYEVPISRRIRYRAMRIAA
ncbi:MAG: MBL fold metallo-hydrolase, partial [Acidimicrobiales bacterium]